MILYLMRHGQTDWNAEEKVQGWNDTPLNETGAEQARAAAGKLSGEKIETIYASDFKRARKSADIISGMEADILKLDNLNISDVQIIAVHDMQIVGTN